MSSSLSLSILSRQGGGTVITTSSGTANGMNENRSCSSMQLEFELGYIIEDYIANGKDRFIHYIEQHLKLCQEYINKNRQHHTRSNSHKMKEIKVQHRVWMLLAYLTKSSSKPFKHRNNNKNDKENNYYFNPSSFIRDECNNDFNLRKLDNLILWLQDIEIEPNYLERGDIYYLRTLNQNKNNNNKNNQKISLDPDNISKQNNLINNEDINDEERLLYTIFCLIRKGLYDDAIKLCRNYGCFWRATSLNGKTLFNDLCDTKQALNAVSGNEEYLMWLRCCNALCQNTKSLSEKWIYASLCGNIDELLTYSNQRQNDGNWYDLLWVLLVCKKIYKQHQLLINKLPSFYHNDLKNNKLNKNDTIFKTLNIINKEWEKRLTDFNSIFEWIERSNLLFVMKNTSSSSNKSSQEAKQNINDDYLESEYNYQYYKICKLIICEKYEELIENCWKFVSNEKLQKEKKISLDFMRFIIHLYLYLNPNIATSSNNLLSNDTFTKFVKLYIKMLSKYKYYDMITRYCFILPKEDLVETLTTFLTQLKDPKIRIELITKSKDFIPPNFISKISLKIAKSIIDESINNSNNDNNKNWKLLNEPEINDISTQDLHKIDSLRCLKIVNNNFNEILFRTNQLFTIFLKGYKFKSIQKLYNEIYQIIDVKYYQNNINNQLLTHFNTFQCFKNYKLMIDSYQNIHNEENINILFIKYVCNLLKFNQGFLNPKYCSIKQLNFNQIDEIRGVVLKRLLNTIYQFVNRTKSYQFLLEIITIFANEKYKYYQLFTNNDENKNIIKQLLQKGKEAKIEMIKRRQQNIQTQQQFF